MLFFISGLILGVCIGCYVGWINAYNSIEKECRVLGRVFIGREVFKCTKIEENN